VTDLGLVTFAGQGELWINNVSLKTPAWWTTDLSPLWGFPDLRGQNTVIPQVDGAVNRLGAPYSNPVEGLVQNLDYLWANVLDPALGSTLSAVLEMPNGDLRGADVQVQMVRGPLLGSYDHDAELFVTVPAGRFEELGS
jgi:hypothetical protein